MTPRSRICNKCWKDRHHPAVVAGAGGSGACDLCGQVTNSFMELYKSALEEIVATGPSIGEDCSFNVARHALLAVQRWICQ